MSSRKRDSVYQHPLDQLADFEFNSQVVGVFEDMINRSVPGYGSIVHSLAQFARLYAQDNTHCYDLGCSLGASALSMQAGLSDKKNVRIIAIDNSLSMIERAASFVSQSHNDAIIDLQHSDILDVSISNASLVTLNFILQFIEPKQRNSLLSNIYQGMTKGACLVLSEKVRFDDKQSQQTLTDLHHRFKSDQGYSELEISQKRDSLENVMLIDTQTIHIERLNNVGFSHVQQWYQNTAFVSYYAIK